MKEQLFVYEITRLKKLTRRSFKIFLNFFSKIVQATVSMSLFFSVQSQIRTYSEMLYSKFDQFFEFPDFPEFPCPEIRKIGQISNSTQKIITDFKDKKVKLVIH